MTLSDAQAEDPILYKVVVNHEEQFSIWPQRRETPSGWSDAGVSGSKAECLTYIESVWRDIRPLSLRRSMEPGRAAPELACPDTPSQTR